MSGQAWHTAGQAGGKHAALPLKLLEDFARALNAGEHPCIEEALANIHDANEFVDELAAIDLIQELVDLEVDHRRRGGQRLGRDIRPDDYEKRFPTTEQRLAIQEVFVAQPLQPGDCVGDFELVGRLGRGGMGEVWEARNVHESPPHARTTADTNADTRRSVALKMIEPRQLRQQRSVDLFRMEIATLAKLENDYIVPLYTPGEADGRYFYTMKLVRGQDLRQFIQHNLPTTPIDAGENEVSAPAQPLPKGDELARPVITPRKAARYVMQAAMGAAAAHRFGIFHCDIKPANILIEEFDEADGTTNDRALLADFGLAVGTPGYMAPEQTDGLPPCAQHDVYSLGATLWATLTGQHPTDSASSRDLVSQLPRSIDKRLRAICGKCLDEVPERRYESATDLAEDLQRYLACKPVLASKGSWLEDAMLSWQRQPLRNSLWVTLSLLLLAAMAAVTVQWRQAEVSRIRAAAETLVAKSERLVSEGAFEGARLAISQAREQLPNRSWIESLLDEALETDAAINALAGRIERNDSIAAAELRQIKFMNEAEKAEYDIIGDYWRIRGTEEVDGKRPIVNPSELGADLEDGLVRARNALKIYRLPEDTARLPDLSTGLAEEESIRIRQTCADLLFLLAIGQVRVHESDADIARTTPELIAACDRAKKLLVLSEQLGNRSHSLYLYRSRFNKLLGEEESAANDMREAERQGLATFYDHLFRAAKLREQGQAKLEVTQYGLALAHRPDGFWTLFRRVTALERLAATFYDYLFRAAELRGQGQVELEVTQYDLALAHRPDDFWTLFRKATALERLAADGDRVKLRQVASILQRLLVFRGESPMLHNKLGTIMLRLRRFVEAADEFEAAIAANPDYFMAYTNKMLAFAEQARVDDALETCERLAVRKPPPTVIARSRNLLGLAYERAKNHAQALENYEAAVKLDPNNPSARRNLALMLVAFGRLDEADRASAEATKLDARSPDVWFVRGNVLAVREKYAAAIDAYSTAIQLDEKFAKAIYNRGVIRRRLKQFEEAWRDQAKVLQLRGYYRDAYYEQAMILVLQQQWLEAVGRLDPILMQNPGDLEALLLRGKVLGDRGSLVDLAQSEVDLSAVIELDPTNPEPLHARGLTRFRGNNWAGASEDWTKFIELSPVSDPRRASVLDSIGTTYFERAEFDTALEFYDQSITLDPKTSSFLTNRANVLLQMGVLSRAIADCDAALLLNRVDPRAWGLRAQARLRMGEFDNAIEDLDEVLEVDETYESRLHRALARIMKDELELARTDIEFVVSDAPVSSPRRIFAVGLKAYVEKDPFLAIEQFSQAVALRDMGLRPFVVMFKARAWLEIGQRGAERAIADAEMLADEFPSEPLPLLEAAQIYTQAAQLQSDEAAEQPKQRAAELLERVRQLAPALLETNPASEQAATAAS